MYGKKTRKFVNDTSGAVLLYVAFMGSVVLGIAGLAIDTGHWYATQRAAQGAADAAAIAAAQELAWSDDIADLTAAANELALMNGFEAAAVTVNHPPLNGPSAGNNGAIEVIIQQPTPGFFSTLFLGDGGVEVAARSVAGSVGGAPACLVSLEPSANQAISVSDSAIDAPGCLVQVNSTSSGALEVKGTGSITAEVICVAGDVTSGGSYTPDPTIGCPVVLDPLAGTPLPSYSGCDSGPLQINGGSTTLSPGVYCGTLEGKNGAVITLDPGIYVLTNGLKLSGGASITGHGVGIFLTGTGNVDLSAGGSVDLSAPTSGEMAGLVFFQDPAMPAGIDHKLSGGSNVGFEGTLYFPTHDIEFSGSSGGASPSPYTTVIARQYKFTGGSSFGFNSDIMASSVPLPGGLYAGGKPALIE